MKKDILNFTLGALAGIISTGTVSAILMKTRESNIRKSMSADEAGSLIISKEEKGKPASVYLAIKDNDLNNIANSNYVYLKVVVKNDLELENAKNLPKS